MVLNPGGVSGIKPRVEVLRNPGFERSCGTLIQEAFGSIDMLDGSLTLFADLAFRGTFPGWLFWLLAVLAVAGTVFIYLREVMKMDVFQRVVLITLRSLALVAILFLLRKPVIVDDVKGERPRPIAVVLDNRQSMKQEDPRLTTEDRLRIAIAQGKRTGEQGLKEPTSASELSNERPSRAEMVRYVFDNKNINLLQGLQERVGKGGHVQAYLFGEHLHGTGNTPDRPLMKNFTATEKQTAMARSIAEILQRDENDLPAGIVLITDGRDNASNLPLDDIGRECFRLKVPLYIYGVGGSSQGYLQLKDVPVQDTLFVEDTVQVPFRWRALGFKQGEVELSLLLNGKPVTLNGKPVEPKRVPGREGDCFSDTISFTARKRDAETTGR